MVSKKFFEEDAPAVAEKLVGKRITYGGKSAVITETEAYGDDDPFCYGVRYEKTAKNSVSFMAGGYVFVYAGMLMITTGSKEGDPQNVLIRKASVPECNGPYNLRKYFEITKDMNGKETGIASGLIIEDDAIVKVEKSKRGKFRKDRAAEDYAHRYGLPEKVAQDKVDHYADIEWRFTLKKN